MSFLGRSSDLLTTAKQYAVKIDDGLLARSPVRPVSASVRKVSFVETARQSCSNLSCASGWTKPWRNRRRPIFEGQWGCSSRCMTAMVKAAVNRETGDYRAAFAAAQGGGQGTYRHRVPLGLVMLAQGWITHPQLQAALQAQRTSGEGRIGDWLISECGLKAEQVTRGLSAQWSCPVLTVNGFSAEEMALVMPRRFIEEFGSVPLRVAGLRLLYLGWEDKLDASVGYSVEQMSGVRVESGLVDGAVLRATRGKLLEAQFVPASLETVSDEDELAAQITGILERKQPLAAQLIRLHQYYWLRLWLESGTKGAAGSLPRSAEDMQDCIFTIGGRA